MYISALIGQQVCFHSAMKQKNVRNMIGFLHCCKNEINSFLKKINLYKTTCFVYCLSLC